MNGEINFGLIEKQITHIQYFLENSLSVYASFGGGKPIIEKVQNFLEKKMVNLRIN